MDTQYYTAREVAKALHVSVMTIYRLINDGRLKAVRIGETYRIPASAVEDYLAANVVN